MADALIAMRALHFAATLIASGTVIFMVLIGEPAGASVPPASFRHLRRRANLLILNALAVALVTGAAWLVLLSADILGVSPFAALGNASWTVLTETRFGWIWLTRFALALVLIALVMRGSLAALQLVIAAVFVAALALAGHAGAVPGFAGDLHRASDTAHLLAAAAWLGGLPGFVLAVAVARNAGGKPWNTFVVGMTQRFSILGILCVAALFASGLVNSWNLLAGPRDLWTTTYGQLIAAKIVLFALMILVAAYNKFRLTPRLPARNALRRLERSTFAEIGLGLCVLAAVAVVGTTEPSAHVHVHVDVHPQPLAIPPDAAFVHIHDLEAMADVTIEPGHVGSARASMRVSREDFSPYPAKAVKLSLEPPKPAGGGIDRMAVEHDGAWSVNDFVLDHPGNWTVRVTIIKRSGETIMLDAPVVIER